MKKTKRYSAKQIGIIVLLSAVALLIAAYIAFAVYFNSHFMLRTKINGIDSSGKTVEEIEEAIVEEINGYQLTINQRDDKTEVLKGTDIALEPVFDGTLNKELKARSGFTWIVSLFRSTEISVETMVTYDEALFEDVVNDLDCLDKTIVARPENAYISEYSSETGYEIVPEKQGNTLRTKKFKNLLKETITNLQETISLEEENCYAKPEYTTKSPELQELVEKMNHYIGASITYEFGENRETLDKERIHQWLNVSEDYKVTIDDTKAAEFIDELAAKYNTAYKAKNLKTSYGPTVTITKGDYGWRINQDGEKEQLLADLEAGEAVTREPKYSQRGHSFGANDYGNTYVELNLTAQHLFFYKNGSLLVESDFVSGNLSKGWDTPPGAFGITYTQRDATLNGEDYSTPVDYWMPFNGNIGMHDATWRRDFGGSYYKTSGSHGCVNLPPDVAKKIFENIGTGDPVLVYELAGTESGKAKSQEDANAVIAAINAIGDISLESRAAVNNARAMYDSLSSEGKGYVSNYDTLINAETVLAQLEAEQMAVSQPQTPEGEQPPVEGEVPPTE